MYVMNGNSLGEMLMDSPGTCPNCGKKLIFGDAAQLAKSHSIQDNVVMCDGCGHIYEVNIIPGSMTPTQDVTSKYAQENTEQPKKIDAAVNDGGNHCPGCGSIIPDDAMFCPFCGVKIEEQAFNDTNETEKAAEEAESQSVVDKMADIGAIAAANVEAAEDVSNKLPKTITLEFESKKTVPSDSLETEETAQEKKQQYPGATGYYDDLKNEYQAAPVPPVANSNSGSFTALPVDQYEIASKKKKSKISKKALTIIGIICVVIILAAVLIPVISKEMKIKKYNEGVTHLENQEYALAKECFEALGSFDDSSRMAEYAQMELDYLTIDDLAASGDYWDIIDILLRRNDFYGDTPTGQQALDLASEYEIVTQALDAKDDGDYSTALSLFSDLDTLYDDFSDQMMLCRAYDANEHQNWSDLINYLYAIQSNQYDMKFLDNPRNDDEALLSDPDSWDYDEIADTISDILQPSDSESQELKDSALNGLKYAKGKELLDSGKFNEAMEIFESLGDFLDSEECYENAKNGESYESTYQKATALYNNGEYFKAVNLFSSLGSYKDSQAKAASCERPLPENGALKYGNGSALSLTITAPSGNQSILLRVYNSSGTTVGQVFMRPGKSATINLQGGTYTMKVAYGTKWYGTIDLFGTSGSYQQLLNGSSTQFILSGGYSYNLTLGGVANGNVGSQSIGGAGGM